MLRRFLSTLAIPLVAGGLLSLAPLSAGAIPTISSTFDAGLEGWTAVGLGEPQFTLVPPAVTDIPITNNAADMVWSATDGNPGGYAQFTDIINEPSSLASAPAAFLGDLTGYIDGTFSFQHRLFDDGPSATGFGPYSLIIGTGEPEDLNVLVWTAPGPAGPTGWEQFDITLSETNDASGLTFLANKNLQEVSPDFPSLTLAGFGLGASMTFEQIMANVEFIYLAFEIADNNNVQQDEDGGIDNVFMTPIPEPTTGVLLAMGLAGLALRTRRA